MQEVQEKEICSIYVTGEQNTTQTMNAVLLYFFDAITESRTVLQMNRRFFNILAQKMYYLDL